MSVLFIHETSAFAASTVYSDNYPLTLNPGEVGETYFLLGNILPSDSQDLVIEAELVSGEEIATLIDSDLSYEVPYGEEVSVPIRIEIPLDMDPGEYSVSVKFKSFSAGEVEGNVQFGVSIVKGLPIIVTGEEGAIEESPVEDSGGLVVWVIFIVLAGLIFGVVVVLVYLIRQRRRPGDFGIEGSNNF